jgi:hypothetical protein
MHVWPMDVDFGDEEFGPTATLHGNKTLLRLAHGF